jgi:hypothetical protein
VSTLAGMRLEKKLISPSKARDSGEIRGKSSTFPKLESHSLAAHLTS